MNRCACGEIGFRFHGDRWQCVIHFRLDCMRECARSKGKYVPSHDELLALVAEAVSNVMKCSHCKQFMVWFGVPGQSNVVSLQHDRSGKIRFLCKECNNRHQSFPADTFYDYPPDWRWCSRCKRAKHLSEFYKGKAGACCRACRKALNKSMWEIHGRRWLANSASRKVSQS